MYYQNAMNLLYDQGSVPCSSVLEHHDQKYEIFSTWFTSSKNSMYINNLVMGGRRADLKDCQLYHHHFY